MTTDVEKISSFLNALNAADEPDGPVFASTEHLINYVGPLIRNDALREAAMICNKLANHFFDQSQRYMAHDAKTAFHLYGQMIGADDCARIIRGLITSSDHPDNPPTTAS